MTAGVTVPPRVAPDRGGPPRADPAGTGAATNRVRHPGDLIRLLLAGAVLFVALALGVAFPARFFGDRATVVAAVESAELGHVLVDAVQALLLLGFVALAASLLGHRRFRVVATTALTGMVAGVVYVGLRRFVVDGVAPAALRRALATDGLVASAHFPSGAWLAAAVAIAVAAEPWLPRSWRRAALGTVAIVGLARLVIGTLLPMELVVAGAAGVLVAAAALLVVGAPDRRLDPAGVAAVLTAGGLPVDGVVDAPVPAKGARAFVAHRVTGERWFVKVLGRDERDGDILYRIYRFLRLRSVDDVRPAASLRQAVEHQALVGLVAERGGVRVPRVDRVIATDDGSALLATTFVEGRSLASLPAEQVSDELIAQLWRDVVTLHRAGIAHRSLRTGNVMVDERGTPWIVDFSFSELSATDRQLAIDRAELIVSLATIVGPQRSVAAAVAVLGPEPVANAVRYIQPLALSAATRRAAAAEHDLLAATRAAVATSTGEPVVELERLQRVQPRTVVMIAVLAGAFYLLLPQMAQVGDAWRAFRSANFAWLALVILLSAATYVGAAIGIMGSIPQRVRLWPSLLVQTAASFVNRVTPASIGGMVLNGRFLEKSGADRATAVAAVGLNSLAGGAVHVVMIVSFFLWSGSELQKAFKLPSTSWILIVVLVVFAVAGAVLWTNWGRRKLLRPTIDAVRSALASLRRLAASPAKMALLFGGSVIVTLAYITAFYLSLRAFSADVSFAQSGTVFLAASALASPSPTPGNLGALEAALVAALTGVGVPGGVAVSSVLTYRLATYWLPVLPGWLAWHLVQRWQYV